MNAFLNLNLINLFKFQTCLVGTRCATAWNDWFSSHLRNVESIMTLWAQSVTIIGVSDACVE